MGILDNFEAWVQLYDEDKTPKNDSLALKMFKECVCNNCGCKDDNSENLLSPEDSR